MVLLPTTENLCPLELIQLNFVSGSRGFRMQKGSDLYQPVFINDLMYPGRKCFPGGSDGKESACNVGDLGSIPGLGRSPREENGNPTPLFLPGESHGWRSLVGCQSMGSQRVGHD